MDTLRNRLERKNGHWHGTFTAMAGLCEILIEPCEYSFAKELLDCSQRITADIEEKFSRYRSDNLCYQINHSSGKPVSIDPETFNLLSFADTCFEISGGLFDLTSGVLETPGSLMVVTMFHHNSKLIGYFPISGGRKYLLTPTQLSYRVEWRSILAVLEKSTPSIALPLNLPG